MVDFKFRGDGDCKLSKKAQLFMREIWQLK